MDLSINGVNQAYLANLQATEQQLQQTQAQLSSGHRLQNVSDDPAAVANIYRLQSQISLNQQVQNNLGSASSELSSADTALQSAITAVQRAVSLAAQGGTSTADATTRANLVAEVQGIQQAILSISQTQANGKFIFSGDQDTLPTYQLDSTQPNGVLQLNNPTNTRTIQDASGTTIATRLTATQIFDAQDSSGNPVSGNVFAALNSLVTSLQNNDQSGILSAGDALKAADDHLNQQLSFYGEAEDRVTTATTIAQKFLTTQQGQLSNLQETDVAASALQITKLETQQQAALSVEAKIQQTPNLFNMLG